MDGSSRLPGPPWHHRTGDPLAGPKSAYPTWRPSGMVIVAVWMVSLFSFTFVSWVVVGSTGWWCGDARRPVACWPMPPATTMTDYDVVLRRRPHIRPHRRAAPGSGHRGCVHIEVLFRYSPL